MTAGRFPHIFNPRAMTALQRKLRDAVQPGRAESLSGFFKTGPGQYGEGDKFLGVRMPDIRAVAKLDDGGSDVSHILESPWHEERLLALLILVRRFERGDLPEKKRVFDFYLSSTRWINNWDLVDVSAYKIAGAWLLARPRPVLRRLARSSSLWERRIAIVSTYAFIRHGDLSDTFALAESLLQDPEDLMHKACGWMLREAGKRDVSALEAFLEHHAGQMPRTMLRYAIERFPGARRRQYLLK